MPGQAILILIVSAIIHSVWNFLSKRSQDQQVFLWLAVVAVSAIFLVPFAVFYTPIAGAAWGYILLSAGLEALYFTWLGQAYRRGDLSLAYPLIRGTGILTATLVAYLALGETLSPGGLIGVGLILGGMYVLHLRAITRQGLVAPFVALTQAPSQLALLTGLMTGTASVVDKAGTRYASPVLYIYIVFLLTGILLAPYMLLARRAAVVREWRANWRIVCVVGVMFLAGYLLVLFAFQATNVSYVSAVREMSVIFAALLGTFVLRESFGRQKIVGACFIFAGIVCIALAH